MCFWRIAWLAEPMRKHRLWQKTDVSQAFGSDSIAIDGAEGFRRLAPNRTLKDSVYHKY
jgi:hypothetical protein